MGKASSSKKVARAARAGGSRRVGQRRNLGFPAAVVAVLVAGVALVAFARSERSAIAEPRANDDHWHAAYNIVICGEVQPPLNDSGQQTSPNIHTHGDNAIHIHPFARSFAGPNADMGVFLETVGLEVTNRAITLPDGTTYTEGTDECDGEPARVAVAAWDSAADAAAGERPSRIHTDDFRSIRFRDDREAYTIAFQPEDDEIPAPDSIATLDQISPEQIEAEDEAPTDDPATTDDPTSTTGPGDPATSTTVPADTTTTAPAP